LKRLQIGENALDRPRPRVATVAQIENKSRISNSFAAESGWSGFILAEKFFDLSEQMHDVLSFSLKRLGWPFHPNAFPTCLGTYLSLKGC